MRRARRVLSGHFEIYATRDPRPGSWFWDCSKSGGIFIDHGLHFFDMFAGCFGPEEVVSAQRGLRPGTGLVGQVNCSMAYRNGTVVNIYHAFSQAGRMKVQEFRLPSSWGRGPPCMGTGSCPYPRCSGRVQHAKADDLFSGAPQMTPRCMEVVAERCGRGIKNQTFIKWRSSTGETPPGRCIAMANSWVRSSPISSPGSSTGTISGS
jgi:hypothetical protein